MIKFAICDDDIEYIESIVDIIKETFAQLSTFNEECACVLYNSGEDLIKRFIEDGIDVTFLDIECGGMSGFDIAKQMNLKKRDLGIVYITNYSSYISDAFVCRPLGFIRKECIAEDILKPMLNIVDFIKDRRKTIELPNGKKTISVPIDNIMAMKVYKHKITVYYNEVVHYKMEEFSGQMVLYEEFLLNNNFVKISRESLINLKYVKDICEEKLILVNGSEFAISRRRMDEVNKLWRAGR